MAGAGGPVQGQQGPAVDGGQGEPGEGAGEHRRPADPASPAEQDALTAAYGRWLNSLTGPAQILIRACGVLELGQCG